MLRILVDADVCPVVRFVERVAKAHGVLYTQDNIDQMLMERHLARKARMGKGKHHLKGPKKRTKEEDEAFETALRKLLIQIAAENQPTEEN